MEVASEAVKALLLSCNPNCPISQLADLSDGVIFSDLLLLVEGFRFEKQKINRQVDSWTVGLNNIKIIEKALTEYYEEVLHKDLLYGEWEPIEVSKNKNEEHILKLFSWVLGVLAQSSNKEFFIERILSLCTDHQAYLASVIRSAIADTGSSDTHRQNKLLEQINVLESENESLRSELSKTMEINNKMAFQIRELEKKVETLIITNQSLRNIEDQSQSILSEHSEIKAKENVLAESLKEKLIAISLEHQRQIIRYKQQMAIMETKMNSFSQLEALADMYKENYEEALEHLSKVNVWQKDKQQMAITLAENTQTIAQKEQLIAQITQKCNRVEQQLLDFQMQYERLKVRYQDLEEQVKKTLRIQQKDRPRLQRHTLTELCPQIKEDSVEFKLFQSTQELQRRNRKIKNLEKQLAKYKAKSEKVHQLEKQKTKLENIIIDFNESRTQEIEVLINCLYELRLKYGHVVEQFSQPVVRQRTLLRSKTQFAG